MKFIKIFLAFSFVVALFLMTYIYFEIKPKSQIAEKIVFEVEPGPFQKVADELYSTGIISNKKLFLLIARFSKADQKLKTGEYELAPNMWPQEILEIITSGKSLQRSFTIPEGFNIFEIAELFESKGISTQQDFLKYVRSQNNVRNILGINAETLEGYLYPDTYFYTKNMSLAKIIQMMCDHFDKVATEAAPQLQADKKLRHRMVILASMIEKETGAPEERPTISSVFHNRLKKGMKLQSDPTVIYGIALEKGNMIKNIRKSDLTRPTRYNTYTIKSLPVGPIANPGKDAILAAINPLESEYLYFVSKNEGRHYFSRTYQEHNQAVREYQLNRKARAGKSWRNMKK